MFDSITLGQYYQTDSILHRLDPRVKLVGTFAYLISLFIVFLSKGAAQISSDFGLNEFASQIITGIILFFILSSDFFNNYKVSFNHNRKEGR